MWGLGCLIWEVFNGPLPQSTALKTTTKVILYNDYNIGLRSFNKYIVLLHRSLNLYYLIIVNLLVGTLDLAHHQLPSSYH